MSLRPAAAPDRQERLAVAAAAGTGVQVGLAMVATAFVVDQTSPGGLAMLRYLIGFLCLLPFLLRRPLVRFAARDVLPIALLGIGQFGVLIALLNFGLQWVPAGRASLIFACFPLLTMLLAAALRLEMLTVWKSLGVLLSIAGVGLALGEGVLAPGSGAEEWMGVLAILGSAATGAVCSVFYRPYLQRYPTLQVSAFAMLASVAALALLAWQEGFFAMPLAVTGTGWLAIVFIGLSSGIGYVLWLWALGHTSPTRVTVFLSLSPVTAILLGGLLLDEAVTLAALAGLACVSAGLWLASRT